jgi:hypothetical protein
MKRLPSSRLGAVTSKTRAHHSLTPLRALPKDRICEDVYPGGFRSPVAGRIYPTAKVIPFPGVTEPSIAAGVSRALQDFSPPSSLCAMLIFAPPVGYFAAFRGVRAASAEIAP